MTTLVAGFLPATPAAAAPGDGVCYLIADSGGGNGGNDLLTLVDRGDFNPATNETNIGTGTGTNNIEAMDMHPGTLQLFGANANRLGTIDKLTGVYSALPNTFTTTANPARGALGNINITDVDGLAFNYSTNVLYGSERQSGNDLLVQIDVATGSIVRDAFGSGVDYVSTNVNTLPGGHDDIDDLAFHPATGVLYGSVTGGSGGRLVIIDPATGTATDVGPFGAGDIEGMRFDAEGFLWGTSGASPVALYEINITTGAATNPRPLDNGGDYESTVCYVPGSDLFVEKVVSDPTPYEGANVTYTVTVFDAGPADATGVEVLDLLPAGVTYVSSTPSQGTYDDATGMWLVGAIDRGDSATLDIVASVDGGTAGTTITNTALRTAVDQGDAVPNNDSASADIVPIAAADLAVNKTVSDPTAAEGDTVVYTVSVTNNGPTGATGVSLSDNLPSGVTFVSASPSQGSFGGGTWTVGSLAAGASATLDITATVDTGTALSTITNIASVSASDQPDPDGSNNSSSADIDVPVAGLEVTKVSDATGPVAAGDTIAYTVTIENTGGLSFTDIVVDDPLPAATTYVAESTVASGWDNQSTASTWSQQVSPNASISTSCAAPNLVTFPVATSLSLTDLNVGFTATHPWRGDIQINVVSPAGTSVQLAPGAWSGHGQDNYDVIFDAQSGGPLNDGDNDNIAAPYDRSVGVSALANFVGEDTAGTWTVEVCDTYASVDFGTVNSVELFFEAGADSTVAMTLDNVPGGATPDLADGTPAALVTAADGFDLAPGNIMTVEYEVVVDSQLDGSVSEILNTVAITSAEFSQPVEASVADPIDFAPELEVDKDGPVGPIGVGDTVTYTYTVNHAPASDGSPVDVTLADDIIDLSTVVPSGDTDTDGLLDGGETWVYSVSYTVPIATADPLVNVATVTGTDGNDEDIPEVTDDHTVDVEFAPALTVVKVGTPDPATVGETVSYTYTVSHDVATSDLSPVGNVAISDSRGLALSGPSGDTNGNTLLDGDETWVYTATETVTTATPDPLDNDVSVGGTDRDGDPIDDATDTESIDIEFAPLVQVVKTGPATAEIGETVTYNFTVSHAPGSDGSPVTITGVSDSIAGSAAYVGGDTDTDGLLDSGESWVYEATHLITTADADPLINLVTVTSTDRDGDPVDDATDTHSTDIDHLPAIVVVKGGPVSALVGESVTFTFAVSHDVGSDGTPVANLTVNDDVAGAATYVSGDDGDGLLESGETWMFTASYTILAGDSDPLINTGTAAGEDEDGDPVEDTDTHSTDVIPTASVGDFVWHDLDGDGAFDTGEPGLDGVTVNLFDSGGAIVATVVTSGGGGYTFADLAPGDYTVDVDESTLPLSGPILSTGNEPYPVTLAEGENHTDADFGFFELATIGDLVWDDLDGDGIQDSGEPGIGGATVVVYDPADLTTPIASTTTLSDGSWSLPVFPGDYVVSFGLPGSYVFSPVDAGADDAIDSDADPASGQTSTVTVASGAAEDTIDAGAYVPVTVGDFVWTDADGDGNQDAGELGLGGVTVRVFDSSGTEVASAVTAADGSYSISLPPGAYDVVVDAATLPAGYVLTTPGAVNTGALESGDAFAAADFGALLPTYPISGTVWNDEDVDTIIGGTEPRLGGVTVELLDNLGAVIASTSTAADGTYSFPPVPDGDYTVSVDETTLPAGMSSTTGNNPEAVTVAAAAVTAVDFGYAVPGSITITKNPASQQVVTGDTVTFDITVTNTGPQDLAGVVVDDPAAPNCDNTIGALAAGASVNYSCTLTNASSDFTNVASVDAIDELGNPVSDSDDAIVDVIAPSIDIDKTPDLSTVLSGTDVTFTIRVENTGDVELTDVTVTDALTSDCDAFFASLTAGAVETYTCTSANVTADFTNVADVTGDDSLGNPVVDSDDAVVDVIAPSIDIEKTPDNQTLLAGDDATFTITVENTGDVELTDVTVTDALTSDCDAFFASLAAGAVETYTCTSANVTADFTNVASVTGEHAAAGSVSDTDTAVVDVIGPAITIDKTPDTQQALDGDTVTFTITVENTGDVVLTDVTVTDAVAPNCDASYPTLLVGASESYSCSMTAGAADFTNTADVTGGDPLGNPVVDSDSADVDVINPAITIDKTPDTQQALDGDTVTFDIVVTNSGDVALTDVTVSDVVAPNCDATFASIAAGASESYSCSMTAGAVDFTNTADVTGDDPLGNPVVDFDTADVDVINPAISIDKTPDSQQALDGDTVTFDIVLTNTGDVALTDVTVTDAVAPDCDVSFASIAAGASESYSCSMTAGATDFTNTADVTGDDPLGNPVVDSDAADVDVISPAITIAKTPDSQQAVIGTPVTFDITVTNTGDVALTDVVVTDAVAPDCDVSFASIAAGASESYSCSMTAGAADFTNTADVTGDDPLGNPVTDSDSADVDVINPAIDIQKTPDSQQAIDGDTVTFDIVVTNTGDVTLTDVTVTDAVAPNCDVSFASIAAGASESYSCSMTAGATDFTNTADVTGGDPLGNPVTDTDSADVDVINPAITIDKTPDTQQALDGDTVTFDITVTNIGDVDLSGVTVTDGVAPNCDSTIGALAAGASDSYSCSMTAGAVDFTNTADVTGDDPLGNPVVDSDTADVDVINPAITIDKTLDTQQALDGDTVTFDIVVTNTGDVALTDVTVTDAVAPNCDAVFPTLAAGASESYSCTMTAGATDFTNTADVTGDDPLGNSVTDTDTADVDVINPAIDVQKTPDSQQAIDSDTVTFDIVLTNTGDVALVDVTVTDAVAPDCAAVFPTLAAGASESYSCSMTAGAVDFTNTANVTGDDPLGNPVVDSDSADVDVINPAIDIQKTPDSQQAIDGDTVTFDIVVTNTGDVALTDVTVTDAVAPSCDASFASIAAGASESFSCSMTAGASDFTNTADVTGDDPLGNPVTDSDSADVDVINPAITIEKTPDTQQALDGDTVTFDIVVTNSGDVALVDVVVTDAAAPNCDAVFPTLAAGASESYSCSMTAGATDFTNTADVAGDDPLGNPVTDTDTADVDVINPAITIDKTPDSQQAIDGDTVTFDIVVTNTGDVTLTDVTVTDAVAPNCDATFASIAAGASESYSCTMTAGAVDFTNIADVTGDDPLGNPVTDTDTADVDVINPAITIEKTPDSQQALDGDTVTFTITVANTGDVDLVDVTVTDAVAPDCDASFASIAAGASESFNCSMTAGASDFTNTADVTGDDPLGNPVVDSDTADVDVINPAISIDKTPDSQQALDGDTVTFDIVVTNTGDVTLTDVTVTDAVAPNCDASFASIAAGASESYSCTMTAGATDFTNTADVTGDDPLGNPVTDTDTADVDVINPAITIDKTPDSQAVLAGGIATFTITIENTGDVALTDVAVTDASAPNCDATYPTLAVGASESYSCTVVAGAVDFTNTADVSGDDPLGNPVTDTDTADVDVMNPTIDIQKTPDSQQIIANASATFTITVTNTGDVALTDVTVTDTLAPDCDNTIGDLASGAIASYTCSLANVTADFTNTAAVIGTHPAGGTVSASDAADVDVIGPAIQINKTPDTQTAVDGGTVTFTITVENTGDVALVDVVVSDAVAPACDNSFATLAAGASESYSCSMTAGSDDFTNTAEVTGDDPLGNPVTDTDTADVDVVSPAITIDKTPDTQQVRAGGTVTFDITVSNTGDVALTDVTVTDASAPNCDATYPTLAVGASESYSCTVVVGAADFTNTADVTADDPLGNPVTDSDDADVDVINPAIDIQKTPDTQQVLVGATVTFSISVTNTGDVGLADVTVFDPAAPNCDNFYPSLAAGATESYTCTVAAGAVDFTNVVDVAGNDPLGVPVTATDDAFVDVVNPAIDIAKNPASQTLLGGETATFTITVVNIGDVPLDNVVVTDPQAPNCDATYATLSVGASDTYTCSLANVTADFTNIAVVAGEHPAAPGPITDSDVADVEVIAPEIDIQKTPDTQTVVAGSDVTFTITVENTGDVDLANVVVTDAQAPACDATFAALAVGEVQAYDCTVTGATANFTNTANVTADEPAGGTVSDSDTADVTVIDPAISIDKSPDSQTILPGDDATFDITVTNTGDVALTNVAITDALAPNCDATYPTLAVGASETYSCSLAAVAAGFTNVANVTGDDPLGNPVTDSDTADVVIEAPAIEITKTADAATVVSGDDATFTITVTNTGTTSLTDVVVTDALAPNCDAAIGDLAVGGSTTYGCAVAGVTADFTNTASVVGDHPFGGSVSDDDSADVDVIAPAISITKDPASQQVLAGQDATFTITVENTGDVDLTAVAVTDLSAPVCDNTIGALAVGQVVAYSCDVTALADFTNTAAVSGLDPLGSSVSDSDDADVDVVAPDIQIEKTPDLQSVVTGSDVTFTITVTNTGDVDLTDVAVADVQAPACDNTIGDLAAGAVTSYDCTVTGVTADFTNTASVVGTHPAGGTVTDDDTADVDVIDPAISLAKDPATQQILAGEDASFTITITNTGDSPLTDVTVTDAQAPDCDAVIPALGVGASTTVTCTAPSVTTGFTNTASVVATHAGGGTVSDSDTADVEVLVPAVDIQKTPDLQIAGIGDAVTFDITVTNAGVVPLSNVTVSDVLAPDCDATIGDLAVGGSSTYSCTLSGVAADFTNTAVVNATDAAGNPATDSDTADVDVVAPAITIEKTPDTQSVVLNDTPTFDITVTNTGDIDLTNVVITDALAPACDATFASLVVGANETFSCSGVPTAADFTNTAAVSADSVVGPVGDSDTADVTVLVPAIDIQKTPDSQLVGPAGTATFTITVTNAGATPLTNVTVSDPLAPNCDATYASLPVGAVETYTCDVTGVSGDFTNTASVTGDDPLGNPVIDSDTADVDFVDPAITIEKTPDLQTLLAGEDASFTITVTNTGDTDLTNVVITDPLATGCETTFATLAMGASETVTCDVTTVAADFTNVASVTADTPIGTQVSDSDDALVDVVAPGVQIEKTPDTQQIHSGGDATFTITVTNNGDQDLVDLTVTDAQTPACDSTIAALAIGESTSYDCTATGVTVDFTNISAVAGTDALGNPVSDSDDAAVDVIDPAIDIQKTPDTQAVVVNGTATFDITVTNIGDVDLTGVTVSDPVAPACDNTIGDLAPGASATYSCSLAGVAAAFTNTASVTGNDPLDAPVTDSDTADVSVLVPAIDIQKTPDLQQARAGDAVDFTITVSNGGATPLSNVTVTDAVAPACDTVIGDLAVGESTSFNCSMTAGSDDFTNTADVTGDDPLGNPVTDSDTADVDIIGPAISIEKSPDGQTVVTGGTATFTIEVTNTGDVDLTGVSVSDAAVPACDATIGDLAVGASSSYTCSVSNVAADFTNTATATGADPIGNSVTDSDTADVTVLVPGIDIQKTPDIQTVVAGDDATFTIIVTNTGQTDLFNVAVSDPLAPGCDNVVGDLPVGSTPVTYTCSAAAAASFTNTATVDAIDPLDNPVTDSDTADVVALVRSNIEGTIAHDVAGDGAIDGTDPALDAVDVTATWAGLDGVFGTADDEVFTTVTDGNGDYSFDLVPPGEYLIDVDTTDLPAGVDFQTLDPDGALDSSTALTLPENTTYPDVDFAYTATGSIGDLVFIDLDGDGTQQPGEPGLGGVTVTVTWLGSDGVPGGGDDVVFTTTTAPDGSYLVDGLPAGEFTVVISGVPAGLTGDLDQTVTLGAAEARDDVDFPLIGSGSIGDQVFEDLDNDGVFDSGEPGVAGVAVNVTWAGSDGVIGTADDVVFSTVTDSNGQYGFDLLPPGEYLVAVDDSTIPADLGTAPPVTLNLSAGETDLTADFPLVGNRPPVAVDDSETTDEDTPVVIVVLDDDSDPDGHSFEITDTTDPDNGSIVVNPDGTITYTPAPGFVGTDTFTYTICEIDGVVDGIPATGLCDTATVTVTIVEVNEPPGPEASFQTVVVGSPVDPMPVFDPDGGPVTVVYISGELPPGITLNPDGTFDGVTTEIGTYQVVVEVCDDDTPQMCIVHTHTIAVTPVTLPGPDDPDPDTPPDTLPFTGANFGDLLLAALAMLAAGGALVRFSQKRTER